MHHFAILNHYTGFSGRVIISFSDIECLAICFFSNHTSNSYYFKFETFCNSYKFFLLQILIMKSASAVQQSK